MLLSKIASEMKNASVTGTDVEITGVCYDSRRVQTGDLFVAMQGGNFDGHNYIQSAAEAGASAFLIEKDVPYLIENDLPFIQVEDGRRGMGEASAAFYDFPSRHLKLIGVTGTSGKTTVTHLIKSIFNSNGIKAGLIGTLGAVAGEKNIPTEHTTPESGDVQYILSEMVNEGVEVVAMETSSHGLFQGRTHGCEFDCGVFTNIARDHLDFHETLEAYLDAKLILFRDYPHMSNKKFTGIINADDHAYPKVKAVCAGELLSFGVDETADISAINIVVETRSVDYDLVTKERTIPIHLGIGGYFNVYNSLAAAGVGLSMGLTLEQIQYGLAQAGNVPGRFESVDCGQDFSIIVDYAHTPDELENVLNTASKLPHKRLIAVFGCGGDRDRGKRPIMGDIASDMADITVVTSDNPRTEDPDSIIREILAGIDKSRMHSICIEPDRRSAIAKAIHLAKTDDIVVIAGKGHEDYQIFADRTIHFDDRETAREIIREMKINS